MTHPLVANRCTLIGMVHLLPLPGSPQWEGSMQALLDRAMSDAEALIAGGCDAVLVENMHDLPYLRAQVYPETVAAMTYLTAAVVSLGAPTGVQVLAAANREALGVALASGATFIRVEGFAYGHVADEGWIDACAGPLLRARAALSCEIEVWADVQKKHSAHALTADLSLSELAEGAAFSGADALIITGRSTGSRTQLDDVRAAKSAKLPVIVGSGVCPDDAKTLAQEADALIVGSWLKVNGHWKNPVALDRVKALRDAMKALCD